MDIIYTHVAMAPKLYKSADVCELAQLQPYVLRSWESEFPGIGVQKSVDSPRLYREADLEQVLRIKQLVFGDGLTLAGARRKLEERSSDGSTVTEAEVAEVLAALGAAARTRIANVQQGLRSILRLLGQSPGDFTLRAVEPRSGGRAKPKGKARAAKPTGGKTRAALARPKTRTAAKPARAAKAGERARAGASTAKAGANRAKRARA